LSFFLPMLMRLLAMWAHRRRVEFATHAPARPTVPSCRNSLAAGGAAADTATKQEALSGLRAL
jgi:hypothetical protein